MRRSEYEPISIRPIDADRYDKEFRADIDASEAEETEDMEERDGHIEEAQGGNTASRRRAPPGGNDSSASRRRAPQTSDEEGDHQEDELCQESDPKNVAKHVKSPGNPSAAERAEHELTHWPFRSWCDACVKGRATGQQHRNMVGEYAESSVARVMMDYGFLHEEETVTEDEHGQAKEAKVSMTVLVMLETLCSSVWAYATEGKGAVSVDWVAQQVVEDLETVGLDGPGSVNRATATGSGHEKKARWYRA